MNGYKKLTLAVFLIVSGSAYSQDIGKANTSFTDNGRPKQINLQRMAENFLLCLNSESSSIVESALGHITYARIAYPDADFRAIQKKLTGLATHGMTRAIRYKAFTALEVFADPMAFQRSIEHRYLNGDGLLDEIGAQILAQSDPVIK